VGAKDDGSFWRTTRFSVHSKAFKLIELFLLCNVPKGPSGESLELAASKSAEGTFFVGDGFRLKGGDENGNFVGSQARRIMNRVHVKSMDGKKRIHSKGEIILVVSPSRVNALEKVEFIQSSSLLTTSQHGLRRECDAEVRNSTGAETSKLALGLGQQKNRHIVNGSDDGPNKLALRGSQRRAETGGGSAGGNVRDMHALGSGVRS
jgi:hypothetical protein